MQKLTGKTVAFYEADITDKDALRHVFAKSHQGGNRVDCVIHFAALKAVGESCAMPLKYYGNNVTGSANLMEVMMEFGVKKIVFSSSATVYGQPQYLPVDEKHPTGNCTNPYGKTKYFMEEIIKDVSAANPDWGCTLLRYFNPVGAHPSGMIGEDPQGVPNNLMPYVAQVAVGRREKLSVYGGDFDTVDGTGVHLFVRANCSIYVLFMLTCQLSARRLPRLHPYHGHRQGPRGRPQADRGPRLHGRQDLQPRHRHRRYRPADRQGLRAGNWQENTLRDCGQVEI